MIAVVYAVQKWSPYLTGRHSKIYTDHFSLKYMMKEHISIPMQQKWLSKFIGYDFEICFRSGKENKVVDSLSRMNEPSKKAIVMAISFPLTDWVEQLKQEWQQDMEIQKLIQELQENPTSHSKFNWEHDLLKHEVRLWLGRISNLKPVILKEAHVGVGGHYGIKKTLARIR